METHMKGDQQRLAVAEQSMEKSLKKVNQEVSSVEKAILDLKQAQEEMNKDPIMKLKTGGIVKQGAFVGFLLFTVRSLGDSFASLGDETYLAGALIQGAIAMVCAGYFFLF